MHLLHMFELSATRMLRKKTPLCFVGIFLVALSSYPSLGQAFLLARTPHSRAFVTHQQLKYPLKPVTFHLRSSVDDDDEEDEDDFVEAEIPSNEVPLDPSLVTGLTVPQLKQQLRLRGLKVSGRKAELVERLLRSSGAQIDVEPEVLSKQDAADQKSKARQFADDRGKELIDVTAYLDEEDVGKETKSSETEEKEESEEEEDNAPSNDPEVWGTKARIVDDYEGRKVVVDSLSETLVEFIGSNQTYQQAHVVATRDALKPFLAGGTDNVNQTQTPAEERLRQIQTEREKAARRPVRFEDTAGVDEGDETGIFRDILDRDFSDWGKYTPTGAQLSAQEVQGVLLLSDVYGAFSEDTKVLAAKIAFECQPIVVMVPDLFNGRPWTGPTDGKNEEGQTYEEWRATHSDLQTSVNIRAAAACLRERYGVSSVVVWGTCYGGGRALEAACGWLPGDNVHDIDGRVGPPLVNPLAAIAWYPTRYNVKELFGPNRKASMADPFGEEDKMAVMAVFAGNDEIPGATPEDAKALKTLLEADNRIRDHLVKVFSDQDHGFAHVGLSQAEQVDESDRFADEEFGGPGRMNYGNGDAEVACLLSTAFMETYSRVFLPTVGPPISLDDQSADWGRQVEMQDLQAVSQRNVRKEIEEANENFVEEPLGGYRIDPTDESQEDELERLLRTMQDPDMEDGPTKIREDDDLTTIYAKLTASDDFELF